ncbi:inovirus Gp2 family protein [Aeromonas media]|uniref:inovirus Gp2 family protein n=1 Tax=Aeromonas media TaxID=651 RepID=UPI003D1F69F2
MMNNIVNGYKMNAVEVEKLLQQVQSMYGEINQVYLDRSLEVVYSALNEWPRVFALRLDLRFADVHPCGDSDIPDCFQRQDPQVITRFIESLKSQLREAHRRKGHRHAFAALKYIWVREQVTGMCPHYHLVLFFNKDHYAFLGNYTYHDGNNMAARLQKAWCSALKLPYPDYATLVNFPSNNAYYVDQADVMLRSPNYISFLYRMAYLCKERTKLIDDGFRNFGCSQIK